MERQRVIGTIASGIVVSTVALVLMTPLPARGQGNPQSQVLGGESALMGGTGVALGTDAAAPFLNPAGVARINQSSLALSSQLIELSYRRISNFRQPQPEISDAARDLGFENTDVTNIAVQFIPTAICYFQNIGDVENADPTQRHTLSLCIGATEFREVTTLAEAGSAASDVLRVDGSSSLQSAWVRRAFNASWGHYLRDWISVGASVVVEQTEQNLIFSADGTSEDLATNRSRTTRFASSRAAMSFAVRGELGAIARISNQLSLGASARTPSWTFASSFQQTNEVDGLDGARTRTVDSGSFEAPAPVRLALGLGYDSDRLDVELDLFLFLPSDGFLRFEGERNQAEIGPDGDTTRDASSVELRDRSAFAVNVGIGARYRLNSNWSLLGGLQTDLSLLEPFRDDNVDGRLATARRDIFHGSFGAAVSGAIGSFVLGLRFSYADGDSLAIDTLAPSPEVTTVDDREYSGLLVLYGSIDFGAVAEELTPAFIKKRTRAAPAAD